MTPMMFIPDVRCAKCGKSADKVERVHTGDRRFIRVTCHGETLETNFVSEPNKTIELWESK